VSPPPQGPGTPPLHASASRVPNCEAAAPANRLPAARKLLRVRRELLKFSSSTQCLPQLSQLAIATVQGCGQFRKCPKRTIATRRLTPGDYNCNR
jgi:hypothetical protein